VGPIRAFAVKFGVQCVPRLIGESPDELGERAGIVDPEGFHGASLP
jgi:hypothetical protein